MKKNIPHLFTLCNLLCGCMAIVFAFEDNIVWSAYAVGIACVFDFLDGMAARLLRVNSVLGKQLDSLADVVSFGLAPGAMMYKMIFYSQLYVSFNANPINFLREQLIFESMPVNFLAVTGFLITVFSAIRLAKFNIDTSQSSSFTGLPTPANTILIASLPLMIPDSIIQMLHPSVNITFEQISSFGLAISSQNSFHEFLLHPYTLISLTLVSSFLLVAPLPLFALKFNNFSWEDNKIQYIFLAIALVLLIVFRFAGVPLIIFLYIVLSIINNLIVKPKAIPADYEQPNYK